MVANLIFLLFLLYSLILLRQKIVFLSRYMYSWTSSKAVHLTKGYFIFCRFVDRKVVGLMPRYQLLAGDAGQISIFSLYNTKTSKQHRYNYLLHIELVCSPLAMCSPSSVYSTCVRK